MKRKIYAVLTGDIVASSKMDRKALLEDLKVIFSHIAPAQKGEAFPSGFELYRGDSFQGLIAQPKEALKYALLIRTQLKKKSDNTERDARIAIGLGTIDYMGQSIATSDGEAFRNSGPILDEMKNGIRIKVTTPWDNANRELEVALILADAIISRWSASQAEVIAKSLEDYKQTEIAQKLKISQSAVNQRLKAAHWEAIESLLVRFEQLIEDHTTSKQ